MIAVLLFAASLFLAASISEYAQRSMLSTAVLFVAVGFLAGSGILDVVNYRPEDNVAQLFAELALISVLFTDGMRLDLSTLIEVRYLPGRALVFGMPLTFAMVTVLGRVVIGLAWIDAALIAAVLSPTDPVFASAIVGREEIPVRLKHLLNIESGLNDGLALPLVVILLAIAQKESFDALSLLGELGLGLLIGIIVPWFALQLPRRKFFTLGTGIYKPFDAFAIELFIYALAKVIHANPFIAAFVAAITVATVAPEVRDQFRVFGERVTELLKLATLLVFAALISPIILRGILLKIIIYVIMVLTIARALGLGLALIGSGLNRRERFAAAWFGPRGFASVVYSLLLIKAGIPQREQLFNIIALVVVTSIIAHSSTDVVIARWFHREEKLDEQQGTQPPERQESQDQHTIMTDSE